MYKKEQELVEHYDHHYKDGITLGSLSTLEKTLAELGVQLRGRVLDLGCGSGTACRLMGDNYDVEVIGVDYSKKRVELAKKNNKRDNVEILYCDLHWFLETTNLEFDVITLFDVIEHLENPAEMIEKARAVLGTRGIIVARIPINHVYIAHLQVFKDIADLKIKLKPTLVKQVGQTALVMWDK